MIISPAASYGYEAVSFCHSISWQARTRIIILSCPANTTSKLKSGDLFRLNLFEELLIDSAYQNKALRDCIVSVLLETYLSQPPRFFPAFQATHRYRHAEASGATSRNSRAVLVKSSCNARFLALILCLKAMIYNVSPSKMGESLSRGLGLWKRQRTKRQVVQDKNIPYVGGVPHFPEESFLSCLCY